MFLHQRLGISGGAKDVKNVRVLEVVDLIVILFLNTVYSDRPR